MQFKQLKCMITCLVVFGRIYMQHTLGVCLRYHRL